MNDEVEFKRGDKVVVIDRRDGSTVEHATITGFQYEGSKTYASLSVGYAVSTTCLKKDE
jgi:hypothetical protein